MEPWNSEPSRFELGGRRVRKQLSREGRDHNERTPRLRTATVVPRLEHVRHGGQWMRPHRGVHHAAVPGRRRVTARAPDRGCVSRREKQSVSPRPVRRPRGARVTRAANPRRFTRFRRVLRACGFLRSADRPPRYRPPRRSSRAREQDRRRREALPRDAFGRRALRHRHAHVVAEPVRRGGQAQEVLRDSVEGLLCKRGEQQEVRLRPRAPRRRLENLGTPLRFSPSARGKRGHPLSRARRAPRTDRGAVG